MSNDDPALTKRFEENRARLRTVAYRMLGSFGEADDAVQEAWLRLNSADATAVDNLGGWLTTVVARVCLDLLRARRARREDNVGVRVADEIAGENAAARADEALALADSVGPAVLIVLEALDPAERVAYVLHDMFDLSFAEIADIIGRSDDATRQLASRARRRIQGRDEEAPVADRARQREVVDAFLVAARQGNFEKLLDVLDPDVVLRADEVAVRAAVANKWGGATEMSAETRGARGVAEFFKTRGRGLLGATIDGSPGAAWFVAHETRAAYVFRVVAGRVAQIDVVMDTGRLAALSVAALGR